MLKFMTDEQLSGIILYVVESINKENDILAKFLMEAASRLSDNFVKLAVKEAYENHGKISAIKKCRELTNKLLKDSKEQVEKWSKESHWVVRGV